MSSASPQHILTASYPKSGATWFRYIVYGIEVGWTLESRLVKKYYPETGKESDWPENHTSSSRVYAKTHLPFWEHNKAATIADAVIILVRNPFDCMMSRLSHYQMEGVDLAKPKKIDRFFEMFIRTAGMKQFEIGPNRADGGWVHNVQSWRDRSEIKAKRQILRYEDLRANQFEALTNLSNNLSLSWSPLAIRRGALLGSKEWMSAVEAYEVKHQIGGMFFSKIRASAFKRDGARFVGGLRKSEDLARFMDKFRQPFLDTFSQPCYALHYDLEAIMQAQCEKQLA